MVTAFNRETVRAAISLAKVTGQAPKRAPKLPRAEPSKTPERTLFKGFDKAIGLLEEMAKEVAEAIPRLFERASDVRTDSLAGDLEKIMRKKRGKYRKRVEKAIRHASNSAARTAAMQRGKVTENQFGLLGVDLNLALGGTRVRGIASNMSKQNLALIRDMTDKQIRDLTRMVVDAGLQGVRAEDLAKQIREEFTGSGRAVSVSKRRAQLIARDQIGKFQGLVDKARQEDLGVEKYVWRTSKDERVRPEHEAREGKVFSWDSPPPDGHPGQPINCRCYPEPVLAPLLK